MNIYRTCENRTPHMCNGKCTIFIEGEGGGNGHISEKLLSKVSKKMIKKIPITTKKESYSLESNIDRLFLNQLEISEKLNEIIDFLEATKLRDNRPVWNLFEQGGFKVRFRVINGRISLRTQGDHQDFRFIESKPEVIKGIGECFIKIAEIYETPNT